MSCCYSSCSHFRPLSILLTHTIAQWRNVSVLIFRRSCVGMCPNKLKAKRQQGAHSSVMLEPRTNRPEKQVLRHASPGGALLVHSLTCPPPVVPQYAVGGGGGGEGRPQADPAPLTLCLPLRISVQDPHRRVPSFDVDLPLLGVTHPMRTANRNRARTAVRAAGPQGSPGCLLVC